MVASHLEILWRNPLPIWARPVEQAAASFELVKTPEPQRRPRSIGSFVLYCWRPLLGVAKFPQALRVFFEHGGTVVHMRKNRNTTAFTSSAVAVNAVDSGERCTR